MCVCVWGGGGGGEQGNEKDMRDRNRIATLLFWCTQMFRQICIQGYHRQQIPQRFGRKWKVKENKTKQQKERKEGCAFKGNSKIAKP